MVTFYARHISYDMSGVPVAPFTAATAAQALSRLSSSALVSSPFTFWTDVSTSASLSRTTPASMRSMIGGMAGSILDVYGGELEFDEFAVKLHSQRGADRGVTIRYGKNLIDINQEESVAECYSGIVGYWYSEEAGLVQGDVQSLGTYPYVKILTLDLSADFQEKPTKSDVNSAAMSYATANQIGVPRVSLTLSYAQLEDEYVQLCDTVHVVFELLGVDVTAKVVRTTYNTLLSRYDQVEIGDARRTIAQTISDAATTAQDLAEKSANTATISALTAAIDRATAAITGVSGGYVVLHQDANGRPYEILIMDSPDVTTAQKIWRWNQNGLGYSSTGYGGPYGTAITSDGQIVADYIATGTLDASQVTISHLSADSIDSGSIDASEVNIDNLNASNIKTGALSSSSVTVGGFTLTTNALRNGMTGLNDTTHDGVFLGVNGIALGKGNFKVTKAGALTCKSGTIANFTIGADAFRYLAGENGGIYIGSGGIIGSAGPNDYKFVLDPNTGKMSCSDAEISGTLMVGGQQITAANLRSGANYGNNYYTNTTTKNLPSPPTYFTAMNIYARTTLEGAQIVSGGHKLVFNSNHTVTWTEF